MTMLHRVETDHFDPQTRLTWRKKFPQNTLKLVHRNKHSHIPDLILKIFSSSRVVLYTFPLRLPYI
jgi:hypothetical protein